MIHGIINIYKEKGFTSHDVVAKARGILREKKIGHTGTLDPDAVGVLPICIGKATKVVPFLTDANKCYEAEVILGTTTTTEDASGEVLETCEVNTSKEEVKDVIETFLGKYIQTPPMYSAIKINGVRLYELARKGIVIDRPSREVEIFDCQLIEWLDEKRFRIRVYCSKGTYIRTLCTDIGKKLGCGAHMGELIRTQVGCYKIEDSITLEQLQQLADKSEVLWPIESIFEVYLPVYVTKDYDKAIYNGNPLPLKAIEGQISTNVHDVRLYNAEKQFIGIYKVDEEQQRLTVDKLFITRE